MALTMTPNEFKKAQLILGLTNQQMADRLGVTVRAVEFWRQGKRSVSGPVEMLMKKLSVENTIKKMLD